MNEEEINAAASKWYDMYEVDKGEDPSFWEEYENYMSLPINEEELGD